MDLECSVFRLVPNILWRWRRTVFSVKIFRDFAEVNGLFRSNVEAAVEDLVTYLGNHFIPAEYSLHSQVPSFVIILFKSC